MAINLKKPKKIDIPLSNPIAAFQDPGKDFLAPFMQASTDIQKEIDTISAGNNNPNTIIPEMKFNPVTDPLVNSGDISTGMGITLDQPTIEAPQIDNIDPTQGGMYKSIAPFESTIDNLQTTTKEFGQNLQSVGQSINETSRDAGNMLKNKAPGLEEAKLQGNFLTTDQLREKMQQIIDQVPDITPEELAETMKKASEQGLFIEGYNDKEDQGLSWQKELGGEILGSAVQGIGAMFGGGAELLGGAMEGTQNIAEGDTALGASQLYGQVPNAIMTGFNVAMPGAGAAISTAFSTDPAQAALEPVMEASTAVSQFGLDNLTNLDPNSEEYQNILKGTSGLLPLLLGAGVAKGGQAAFRKTFGENIKYDSTVGDFAKATNSTVDEFGNAMSMFRPNTIGKMNESTKLSDLLSPDEFSQIQNLAKSYGNPLRKEGIITRKMQSDIVDGAKKIGSEVVDKVVEGAKYVNTAFKNRVNTKRAEEGKPLPATEGNAVTSEGVAYTMDDIPGILTRTKNNIFTRGSNEDLASRAVTPRSGKKTDSQKLNSGKIALAGLSRIHNEAAKGNINADVATMEGGIEGAQQALEYHGRRIGEVTGDDSTFSMADEVKALQEAIEKRGASVSPDLNTITKNVLQDFAEFGSDISVAEAQQLLSTIKSVVFSDPSKIKQLSSTISGSALDDFLKAFEKKFESAIEESSGRYPELKESKAIYREIKQFLPDLLNSHLVEMRNQARNGGLSNAMGNVAAIMEIARNPSLSSMMTAGLIKVVSSEIGKGKTRNASYEKLMQNLKMDDIARAKGKKGYTKKASIGNTFEQGMRKTTKYQALPQASGKATGAKNFRVNQQSEKAPLEKIRKGINLRRPGGEQKTTPAEMYGKKQAEIAQKEKEMKSLKQNILYDIASVTNAARLGGTGNQRIESKIKSLLSDKVIDREMAIDIVTDIIESVDKKELKFAYTNKKDLETFLESLYSKKGPGKGDTFEGILSEKRDSSQEISTTPKDLYDEIERMANDRRYNIETVDAKIKEFEDTTGKNIYSIKSDSFGEDGQIASSRRKQNTQSESTEKYRVATDMNAINLTTKILEKLGDRETVSKEFIQNLTNSGDVKQIEKDIIRGLLESEGDKVNVPEFKIKVQAELLPLRVKGSLSYKQAEELREAHENRAEIFAELERRGGGLVKEHKDLLGKITIANNTIDELSPGTFGGESGKYESISLPSSIRGEVKDYKENIYESPVRTDAGSVHFPGKTQNYFGHTRIEDMADGSTRRVIEVQSDLFQKGRLERELGQKGPRLGDWVDANDMRKVVETNRQMLEYAQKQGNKDGIAKFSEELKESQEKLDNELAKVKTNKLSQYNDPTAHFRMIREEVGQAAQDGITKLQFPTGETAMKIEGLVNRHDKWVTMDNELVDGTNIQEGSIITYQDNDGMPSETTRFMVTKNNGDGTFEAVDTLASENDYDFYQMMDKKGLLDDGRMPGLDELAGKLDAEAMRHLSKLSEQLSAKDLVDTNNPIYKFYEKEVGRYLKNKYDAKPVTDENGVNWYEVDIKPEMSGPVEAFRTLSDEFGKDLTTKQKNQIKSMNQRIFGDDKVELVEGILSNRQALGSYKDGIIKIMSGQGKPMDTYLHEAVHKYLDVFLSEKEHMDILKEASEQYGIKDFVAVEEKLAEDFIKFSNDRSGFKGAIKSFFENFIARIKKFFGNQDKINELYNDIRRGKAKNKGINLGRNKGEKFRDTNYRSFSSDR